MINPFVYVPCADMACYMTLPLYLYQNGYAFLRTSYNPTTSQAQYVWQEASRGWTSKDYHQDA